MSAPHDALTQIGVNEDCFFPILCKGFGELIGHATLAFVRRTAGHTDDPDIFSGEFDIRAERFKCFFGTEILFFQF